MKSIDGKILFVKNDKGSVEKLILFPGWARDDWQANQLRVGHDMGRCDAATVCHRRLAAAFPYDTG